MQKYKMQKRSFLCKNRSNHVCQDNFDLVDMESDSLNQYPG